MNKKNNRNTIFFVVITAAILILYQIFYLGPQAELRQAAEAERANQAVAAGLANPEDAPVQGRAPIEDRTEALAASERVPIQTPTLSGSLSLLGGRIDDLFLTNYRQTLDPDSPPVELFRPQGMEHAYFAQFGWTAENIPGGVPGPNTVWRLTSGQRLTPQTPITLTWDNGAGLRFTRVISVDDQYVFTVADTVANLSGQAITLAPYGMVERDGIPEDLGRQFILHEGAIGTFVDGGATTRQIKYGDWAKRPREEFESTGGWLGITDKYWLAAVLPEQSEQVTGLLTVRGEGAEAIYRARMQAEAVTINPGRQITETQRLFAGAKREEILAGYEDALGLPRFVYAIDWGMFWFLTRPIFLTTEFFFGILGNFGLAILALTVVVKLIMFPLANKAYESMSKMRTLSPKLEEIKKKHGADPQKQQQEMMALYQREKINPLAGCLPILVQIPVFYALYKVLFVTIEMRHAPFFGWIQDLSARDPSNIWNLFGLIPWDPDSAPIIGGLIGSDATGGFTLGLSVLAIVYGLTMWLQQAMNPPAPDPVQRQIFAFMPILFTFIMAPFAAGLLIYWTWNNVLSILQQYIIMHRFKAENPIDTFIERLKARGAKA
ncbi:membrane protein insertase YidC [Brevundimonas balnearis]|uniref:Membrane protein insertase YidC n=1 Tax=Brevundimonas balnearis TaxID=1572858 RepID=A0ABV6R2U1_9CAUL